MRTIIPFNNNWLYTPNDVDHDAPDSAFERVALPHTNIVLPHHNFDNMEYQFVSTYRKRFRLPEARDGRRVFIDFEGAMTATTAYLNGHKLGDHGGGYVPFSFDITDYLIDNAENVLSVRLDSTERSDIPPYGGIVDYLTFGGIYREVSLRYVEPVYIADVFVKTFNVLMPTARVEVDIFLRNTSNASRTVSLQVTFASDDQAPMHESEWLNVSVPPGGEVRHNYETSLKTFKLWTLDQPTLYSFEVDVVKENGTDEDKIDNYTGAFGFREARFTHTGFYLNGERVKLMGLNRHQTYPFIGAAAPARLQRKDADIIKYELGCNIVRTSHYPQSKHFIERCDEIGLLVFEEIPGWQHVGDEDWQALNLRDLEAMIVRDRNHPSIVIWGVRVNESFDNDALYTKTNAFAHQLDPTRQTGGVRFFQESSFLEDVFTFNDFSNDVQDPLHTPHLITEFNGHMFSTKTWDQEERAMEHALRHARIQDKQIGHPQISGAIGWCAFDYNTHREFGSGDRVCYHGVMDTFRLPKFAAYVYESQQSPDVRPILRAVTYWTRGDRSVGGADPLWVFTNCEEVEMFVGKERFGRFTPDRETFPNLPYAPVQIKGFDAPAMWSRPYGELRLVGYIGGEAVTELRMGTEGFPIALTLEADDNQLNVESAEGTDMTRLVFKLVDKFGNRLPYTNQVVSFEIDGPGELIGENPFAIMGGQAALYLKSTRESGVVTVTASTPRLPSVSVTVTMQ